MLFRSSLSDLLEEAFEKPRQAPRLPIPAAFMLEVVDDYKMEYLSESHFNCEEGPSTDSGFIDSIVSILIFFSHLPLPF